MSIFQTLSADASNRFISQTRQSIRPDETSPDWLVSWVEAGAANGLNAALPSDGAAVTGLTRLGGLYNYTSGTSGGQSFVVNPTFKTDCWGDGSNRKAVYFNNLLDTTKGRWFFINKNISSQLTDLGKTMSTGNQFTTIFCCTVFAGIKQYFDSVLCGYDLLTTVNGAGNGPGYNVWLGSYQSGTTVSTFQFNIQSYAGSGLPAFYMNSYSFTVSNLDNAYNTWTGNFCVFSWRRDSSGTYTLKEHIRGISRTFNNGGDRYSISPTTFTQTIYGGVNNNSNIFSRSIPMYFHAKADWLIDIGDTEAEKIANYFRRQYNHA
jgi:hypothetical protein